MRKIFFLLAFISFLTEAKEYGVPVEYEAFMDGYEYIYPEYNCSVHWHPRSATFMVGGEPDKNNCEKLSIEKIKKDAIKSINYVKSQGNYESFFDYFYKKELAQKPYSFQDAQLDAMRIWIKGCSDYKKGRITQNFPEAYDIGNLAYLYPRIKSTVSVIIYGDGWETALANKSQLNCQETAYYLIPNYLKGMKDIRESF